MNLIAENVKNIRQRMHAACIRVGRNPEEVTLIAVTKKFGVNAVMEALQTGLCDIGENYVQELRRKRDQLRSERVKWHFLGHLQKNKIKYIADWIHLIHSVDSLGLGENLSEWSEKSGHSIDVLVEVNTSGEESKFGVLPEFAAELVGNLTELPRLNVKGLMTMGPLTTDPAARRSSFRTLRLLKESLGREDLPLTILSMGMTDDFEIAIEEGATMVRIGTAIFGRRG